MHLLGNVRDSIREFDDRHSADDILKILATIDDLAYMTTPGAGVVSQRVVTLTDANRAAV